MRSQFLVAFHLKFISVVSKLGREVVDDMYSAEMIQKSCEGFRTPKMMSETLHETNIWYWTSIVVYSCTRTPALCSCCELIQDSGQLWIYSRRVEECAHVHVNLQNCNTCKF